MLRGCDAPGEGWADSKSVRSPCAGRTALSVRVSVQATPSATVERCGRTGPSLQGDGFSGLDGCGARYVRPAPVPPSSCSHAGNTDEAHADQAFVPPALT